LPANEFWNQRHHRWQAGLSAPQHARVLMQA
jgi:hypothetical protein